MEKIAIAGAGIGGLAAALGLARLGYDVNVFERAASIEEVGAGLQIGPNAVRALEALGAWPAVARIAFRPQCISIRDGQTGRQLTTMPLGSTFEHRFGKPYLVAHRADLLNALLETARTLDNISIITGAGVTGIGSPDEPVLELEGQPPFKADILIGADGIRSTVRQHIPQPSAPRAPSHTIYRALLPASDHLPHDQLNRVTLWLCNCGHVVQYPLSDNRLNIVAIHNDVQELTGWSTSSDSAEVARLFATTHRDLQRVLAGGTSWLKWPGCDLNPRKVWGAGKVTLLGDAAHATLPYLAQGAAMALEDAAVLARQFTHFPEALEQALRRYETVRIPRTRKIILESRKMGDAYHLTGLMAHARNFAMRSMSSAAFRRRLGWVYDWNI
jgi:salicylate hydroxylase